MLRIMQQYLEKLWGIPKENIIRGDQRNQGDHGAFIGSVVQFCGSALEGEAELVFYYSGHGSALRGNQGTVS